jgi:hypothetical protein
LAEKRWVNVKIATAIATVEKNYMVTTMMVIYVLVIIARVKTVRIEPKIQLMKIMVAL